MHTTCAKETVELPTRGKSESGSSHVSLEQLVKKNVPELENNTWFWQSPALGNGHLQTLYAAAGNFEHVDKIYYGRRLITFEDDGATVSVDYVIDPPSSKEEWQESLKYSPIEDPPRPLPRTRFLTPQEINRVTAPERSENPLVITLHGLSGGSHESYVRAAISQLSNLHNGKFDCAVINSRGCARTRITTPRLFCALMTDDIRRFVKLVHKEQPGRKIFLVGYSLGAAILANYIGQEGEDSVIAGAVCVGNPWDLCQSSYFLNGHFLGRNLYSPQMTKNLLRLAKNNREMLEKDPVYVEGRKQKIQYIHEFDAAFTAPLFGFTTSHDYYRNASPVHRLINVRTPLLILNALDDPIADSTSLPYAEVKANPYTYMAATDLGGHLGWFKPGKGGRWFPPVIAKFIEAIDREVDSADKDNIISHLKPVKRYYNGDRLVFH